MSGKKNQKQKENDLKKELVLDVHTVSVEELSDRFGTDVETGLTTQQAKAANVQYGLNELTPPPPLSKLKLAFAYSSVANKPSYKPCCIRN